MDMVLLYSFLSVLLVSLISLVGIITFLLRETFLKKVLLFLVSFSAGALLGDAFIHLLPDVVEKEGFSLTVSLSIIASIIVFFILEKFVGWRHCHEPTSQEHPHPLGIMNLVGMPFTMPSMAWSLEEVFSKHAPRHSDHHRRCCA